MSPKRAPAFDREAFLAAFAGIENVAFEAIDSFLKSLPALITEIEGAVRDKNATRLEFGAHTLKGAVANFRAERARRLAGNLEQMGQKSAIDEAHSTLAELKAELESLSTELAALKELK